MLIKIHNENSIFESNQDFANLNAVTIGKTDGLFSMKTNK